MSRNGATMLFAAPLPPIWVPRSRAVVIGRAVDCDLSIPSRRASRHHARVGYGANGRVLIEDLESTNGTRVNGLPIDGPHELRPGDEIEVGGMSVTFCQVDDRFEMVSGSDQTLALNSDIVERDPEAFRGDLSEIPISVVLQILESGRKSGRLEVETPKGPVRMWTAEGRPAHAEAPGAEGPDAAFVLCGLPEGRFSFERGTLAPSVTLVGTVTELLLEYSRSVDEETQRTHRPV